MSRPAVEVHRVGVEFRPYVERAPTIRRVLARRGLRHSERVVALFDVSFEVQPGEILGLVGDNGAGKSTLLRVIARTMRPNTGQVIVRGKTSTLLQLGAGFNNELSGRRNVFLSGMAHGLRRAQVREMFEGVVAFSGVGAAIDRPLKTYSSGMLSRLAFAISVHLDPNILLLDEVLAVGDAHFRQKSLAAMYDLLAKGGTVIVASHSLTRVAEMCHRVVWLDKGVVRGQGLSEEVVDLYMQTTTAQ